MGSRTAPERPMSQACPSMTLGHDAERSTALGPPYEYLFTVFTPTYNRASTLPRVYESLKRQTFRDFEWLIVDDGSADNTGELVASWQAEARFPIRYFWQENAGKHVAFNRGVLAAKGSLFVTLDSDDACIPKALERFKYHWESIPESDRSGFSGVRVLCTDTEGRIIGDHFPADVVDAHWAEMCYRFGITGEKWDFYRTDVLKRYPFPVAEGQRYVPEAIVWRAIGRAYLMRHVDEALRIYYCGTAGSADQLTRIGPAQHVAGRALYQQSLLNDDLSWFRYAPGEFCRSAIFFVRFSLHSGAGPRSQVRRLKKPLAKVLWAAMLPMGCLLYWRDKRLAAIESPARGEQ